MDCIFCKIVSGDIPSERIYEDDRFLCIRDVAPQAKEHLLVLPKKHIRSLAECFPENGDSEKELIGDLFETALKITRSSQLLPHGFRSVINTNEGGGQSVFHLHLHLLGGEDLSGEFA